MPVEALFVLVVLIAVRIRYASNQPIGQRLAILQSIDAVLERCLWGR
jgi:hypothetical protein